MGIHEAIVHYWVSGMSLTYTVHVYTLSGCREFMGPVISGVLTQYFDFQTSTLVSVCNYGEYTGITCRKTS